MREIKYRGLREDGNGFAYGYVNYKHASYVIYEHYIIYPSMSDPCGDHIVECYIVDPNTVGQYTGLKDKNGKEIYEGDILQCYSDKNIYGGKLENPKIDIYNVEWDKENGRWGRKRPYNKTFELLWGLEQEYLSKWYTKIGNIYQNPELLENRS
jgi:uncharacterized phage protein (TIGR01671 family)